MMFVTNINLKGSIQAADHSLLTVQAQYPDTTDEMLAKYEAA